MLNMIIFPALLRQQQPGIFERKLQSLLHRCRLCIKVGGRTSLNTSSTKNNFFFLEYVSVFALFDP